MNFNQLKKSDNLSGAARFQIATMWSAYFEMTSSTVSARRRSTPISLCTMSANLSGKEVLRNAATTVPGPCFKARASIKGFPIAPLALCQQQDAISF
jgi:hypothetical protein